MRFFARLSVVTKISIVPAIAIVSFVIFLSVIASMGVDNNKLLDHAQAASVPALRASDRLFWV